MAQRDNSVNVRLHDATTWFKSPFWPSICSHYAEGDDADYAEADDETRRTAIGESASRADKQTRPYDPSQGHHFKQLERD